MNSGQKLLSYQETADYFGVTKKTLYEWIADGIITAIKIRRKVFFHPDEIDRVLKENRVRRKRRKYF